MRGLQLEDLVDIFLVLRDEDPRAGVLELMPNFRDRAGGVDAVGDRADGKSGQVRDEIFEARIAHDRDAIARLDAEREQAKRKRFDLVVILPPGNFLVKAEILVAKRDGVRSGCDTL